MALYTVFVPCLKIQGGYGSPPAADAHGQVIGAGR